MPHITTTTTVIITTTVITLLSLLQSTTTTTLPSEITALKSIKSHINPTTIPSYSCLATWNFTSDPCSTPHITHFLCGLTCSTTRVTRITQLTFDRVGYSGTLSPLISQLTHLTTIDLSDNHLSGPIPTSLFSLPSLHTLNLRSNSFSGNIPSSLINLNLLETLDLSHNSLSGNIPDTSTSLTLTRLDLSFNSLTGPIPKLAPNLIELALKSNSISGFLTKPTFTELTQLEVVELSNNSLTGSIPSWLFLLPSLQQINLSSNNFTGLQILNNNNINNNNIVAIDVGFNKITGYLTANFTALTSLSSLTLSNNNLQGPIPVEYGKKSGLKRLFLEGNYLNGVPPAGLVSGESGVAGSLGDNCLKRCPVSSELCVKSQKPTWICRQVYGGKVGFKS